MVGVGWGSLQIILIFLNIPTAPVGWTAQQVKLLAAKAKYLSLISRTHKVDGEN